MQPKLDPSTSASPAVPTNASWSLATQAEIQAALVLGSPRKAQRLVAPPAPVTGVVANSSTFPQPEGTPSRARSVSPALSTIGTSRSPSSSSIVKSVLGTYVSGQSDPSDAAKVASIRRGLGSPAHDDSRELLRSVFSKYASPARASDAERTLRRAFDSPDFEHQRRILRAAFSDLMPSPLSAPPSAAARILGRTAGHSADDYAFSAVLSASTKVQGLLRGGYV